MPSPASVLIVLDRPALVIPGASLADGLSVDELRLTATDHEQVVRIETAIETSERVPAFVRKIGHGMEVACHGQRHVLTPPSRAGAYGAGPGDGAVLAPMPGTVVEVRMGAGQHVAQGTSSA